MTAYSDENNLKGDKETKRGKRKGTEGEAREVDKEKEKKPN